MSFGVRCQLGLKLCPVGTVISPDLKKAKKPRQQAAHSMMLLKLWGDWLSTACTLRSMYGVTGSREFFELGLVLLNPFSASCSLSALDTGSPKPCDICMWRIADRYDLTELGLSRCDRSATQSISICSCVGSDYG